MIGKSVQGSAARKLRRGAMVLLDRIPDGDRLGKLSIPRLDPLIWALMAWKCVPAPRDGDRRDLASASAVRGGEIGPLQIVMH
jgi:hypothetical protein